MRWSQLKKRIEGNFAQVVSGHIEIWSTRYRKAEEQEGEFWITVDKNQIFCSGTGYYWERVFRGADQLSGADSRGKMSREESIRFWNAWEKLRESVHKEGIFTLEEVTGFLYDYLSMNIDDIISSDNPLIQSLGMLDKRLGKRRLNTMNLETGNHLARQLYTYRCKAEGLIK